MPSVARVEASRRNASPGRARLLVALVVSWVVVQGLVVSNQYALLNVRSVWAVLPICIAACAASVGYIAAQRREMSTFRKLVTDTLRFVEPYYALAIIGMAVVLGPLSTTEYRANYITDPQTWAYLLNLLGLPRYSLPGVFSSNPLPEVANQNVWIAPCIGVIVLIAGFLPVRRLLQATPLVLALLLAVAALLGQVLDIDLGDPGGPAALVLRGDGLSGLFAGIAGVVLYRARRRIPLNAKAAAAAATVVAAIALAGHSSLRDLPAIRLAIAGPAAYIAIVLLHLRWSPSPLASRLTPYLPGLLLFSFPLQQAAVEAGPSQQAGLDGVVVGGAAAMLLAVATWETIGRRLVSSSDRDALAEAALARRARATDRRKQGVAISIQRVGAWLLAGLIVVALALGMAMLVYVAFLPDRGGI